jgi:NADPH2:quinone reductase
MKAIRVHALGGPEVLAIEQVPDPAPAPGEALVRVEAAGINFIEVYQRRGWYSMTTPFTPGGEGAGTVVAVGQGVTTLKPGDRVASTMLSGAYAELAVAPVDQLVPIPGGVSTRDVAAALLQGMTAHYLTHSTYPLARGEWCLVHAAAGGTGLLLCQIAKRRGATVIGTTSTPEKAALAREAGADHVILYTRQQVAPEVRRLTGGRGVQVVYDSVGKTTFEGSIDSLARRGMMVLFGQSSGPVDPFDIQTLNRKGSLFLTRPTLQHYTATREELLTRAGDLFKWMLDGTVKIHEATTFPLAEAAAAHTALEGRGTTGKLLLIP